MLVRGQDIAQVGSVKDVFKSRQNLDPDMRPVFSGYEAIVKISNLTSEDLQFRRSSITT